MQSQTSDLEQVTSILEKYFQGLYHGDIQLLASICAEELVLFTPNKRRTLRAWLEDVDSRPTPKDHGEYGTEGYNFKILSIELVGLQAMAKLYCPLLGHKYIDFIGLLKEQDQWKIVSKIYSE